MKPTNLDKLFALKALEQKITEERKLLEYECRDELLEAYKSDGTDRRTSPYFGADAGKFSVKHFKAKPGREVVTFELKDWDAFNEWVESNKDSIARCAFVKAEDFAQWWVDNNGELPDGIIRTVSHEEGKAAYETAQIYSFKADKVLEKLSEGGNVFEGANQLLLSDGND